MAEKNVTPGDSIQQTRVQFTSTTLSTGRAGHNHTSQRRYTPYQKTPTTRKIKGHLKRAQSPPRRRSKGAETSQTNDQDDYKAIVNKTLRAFKVTPLYGLSTKQSDLKKISHQLGAQIIAECQRGMAVAPDDTPDKASITVLKGLQQHEGEPESLLITLKAKARTGTEEKVVLTAVLCSVALDDHLRLPADRKHFTFLPLMLVKGPVTLTDHLRNWLHRTFDCCSCVLHLESISLSWMVAMWAGELPSRKAKPVELLYEVPGQVTGLSRIVINVDPTDCQKLWKSIHKEGEDDFQEEEVEAFLKSLEAHFFHHFKIHINSMKLSRVGTAIAYVGVDGRLKVFSASHVIPILAHLTELAAEQNLIT